MYSFHVKAFLARLAVHGSEVSAMKTQAASESLLLTLYDVRLPPIQSPAATPNLPAHQRSVHLLQKFNPWILTCYLPVDVSGDGYCFFCALSYSLYGCEGYHALLRLPRQTQSLHTVQRPHVGLTVKSRIQYARFLPKIEVRKPGCV